MYRPSLVESKGEGIAIRCQESSGLKAAISATVGRCSKATSGDRGTEATRNTTSLEFYVNLVAMKGNEKKKKD